MTRPQSMQDKVQEAERLCKKTSSFWGFGAKPDYMQGALLFEEVADEANSQKEKEKYYVCAVDNFLKTQDEYGTWRACECYGKLYSLFIKENRDKASEYQERAIDLLKTIKKWTIAGQKCIQLVELYEIDQVPKALAFFNNAIECYQHVDNYKANLKSVKLKALICLITMKQLAQIIDLLKNNPKLFDRQKFCLQLLLIMEKKYKDMVDDDLENPEEQAVIDCILNDNKEDAERKISEFRENTHLNLHAELILNMFLEYAEYSKFEDEIC